MVWTALAVMVAAVTAHHLGLTEAVAEVAGKVAGCPKCCSFWAVLGTLLLLGEQPLAAIGLSLLAAYCSYWVGLLLLLLNKIYSALWETLQKKAKKKP